MTEPNRSTTAGLATAADARPQLGSASQLPWQDLASSARSFDSGLSASGGPKSLVVTLAYEEYCRRLAAGEQLDRQLFCDGFPDCRSSLFRVLDVHHDLEARGFLGSLEPVDWPKTGSFIRGFDLIEELGRGAIGRVFLAQERALGNRQVVVKLSRYGGDEAEILGKLPHPNVVTVYSVQPDEATGLTVICMPYCGRTTLLDVLDLAFGDKQVPRTAEAIWRAIERDYSCAEAHPESRGIPIAKRKGSYVNGVLRLAVQLAEALAYTHSRGVYHRDLKPSNVLVAPDGRAVLLDFNLSTTQEEASLRVGGTLPYMAPEQIRATLLDSAPDQSTLDGRADLFSLGVILYQLLCGELPFGLTPVHGSSPIAEELLARQQAGPAPIRSRNPQVDPRLARIVARCLAFDPGERFGSADALVEELRGSVSALGRGSRWATLHPWRSLATAGGLVGLAVSMVAVAATRPAYAVAELNDGLSSYEAGDYRAAADHLDRAVEADPTSAKALAARGRARQKLGNFLAAYDDYARAEGIAPDPRLEACIGFCRNQLNDCDNAILFYRKAIDGGFNSAEIYNNLGYSYCRLGQFDLAVKSLGSAAAKAPRLQVVWHNYALATMQLALEKQQPVPDAAVVDIQQALQCGRPSAILLYDAAFISGMNDTAGVKTKRTLKYLAQAISMGVNPALLKDSPAFGQLKGSPEFQRLLAQPMPGFQPTPPSMVIELDYEPIAPEGIAAR